jgi:hypothetical protein
MKMGEWKPERLVKGLLAKSREHGSELKYRNGKWVERNEQGERP